MSEEDGVRFISMEEASKMAYQEILDNSQEDVDATLKTRWVAVNKLLTGGFRPNNNYYIGGPSGHGKSYLLNMLRSDFLNRKLNYNFYKGIKILNYSFEMSASDEIIRTLIGDINQQGGEANYEELLSVNEKLPKDKLSSIKAILEGYNDTRQYFIETTLDVDDIYETTVEFQKNNPEDLIITSLDHTLLTEYGSEKTEVELLANIAKMYIHMRKQLKNINLILGQLNDKIEDPRRRQSPALHYPTKTDIHGSKQLYHAVDAVLILLQPAMLNLVNYGPESIDTELLVALHCLKQRKGSPGVSFLQNELEHANFGPGDGLFGSSYGYEENFELK